MQSELKRLVVFTPLISRAGAGLYDAVRCLAQAQRQILASHDLQVFSLTDDLAKTDEGAWNPIKPVHFPRQLAKSLGFNYRLAGAIKESIISGSLLHIHGVWEMTSYLAGISASKTSIPYVISPHGMLDAWALSNSKIKKKIAITGFVRRHIQRASCMHALCEAEYYSIRQFGYRGPVAIIKNGVNIPEYSSKEPQQLSPWDSLISDMEKPKKVLLFLGRITEKKGVLELIESWNSVQKQLHRWRLVIAGPHESEKYIDSINAYIQKNNLQNSIMIIGPQFGKQKIACFQNSDAFALTSFSEGVPLAVLEAAAYKKPVVLSEQCNLPDLKTREAAITVDAKSSASIAGGLLSLVQQDDHALKEMALRGYKYVSEMCTWKSVAEQHLEVYSWLLGIRTTRPSFIRLD